MRKSRYEKKLQGGIEHRSKLILVWGYLCIFLGRLDEHLSLQTVQTLAPFTILQPSYSPGQTRRISYPELHIYKRLQNGWVSVWVSILKQNWNFRSCPNSWKTHEIFNLFIHWGGMESCALQHYDYERDGKNWPQKNSSFCVILLASESGLIGHLGWTCLYHPCTCKLFWLHLAVGASWYQQQKSTSFRICRSHPAHKRNANLRIWMLPSDILCLLKDYLMQ